MSSSTDDRSAGQSTWLTTQAAAQAAAIGWLGSLGPLRRVGVASVRRLAHGKHDHSGLGHGPRELRGAGHAHPGAGGPRGRRAQPGDGADPLHVRHVLGDGAGIRRAVRPRPLHLRPRRPRQPRERCCHDRDHRRPGRCYPAAGAQHGTARRTYRCWIPSSAAHEPICRPGPHPCGRHAGSRSRAGVSGVPSARRQPARWSADAAHRVGMADGRRAGPSGRGGRRRARRGVPGVVRVGGVAGLVPPGSTCGGTGTSSTQACSLRRCGLARSWTRSCGCRGRGVPDDREAFVLLRNEVTELSGGGPVHRERPRLGRATIGAARPTDRHDWLDGPSDDRAAHAR